MNYRHGFHAGNFADVVKHAVLCRILVHLKGKPTAFRVIDTHAGAARYDLGGPDASRTGEWREGIGRLRAATLAEAPAQLLAPYLQTVARFNPNDEPTCYPGSPLIIRAHLRPQDRLTACELEPDAAAALARNLAGDDRCKAVTIDGWTALNAYVPPKERRGLILIDPAFEQADEFAALPDRLLKAYRKWPSGTYLLWYPIKGRREPDALARRLAASGTGKILRAELTTAPLDPDGPLAGSGLVIVNPPWTLYDELSIMLPALAAILGRNGKRAIGLDWLSPEK
jgi:23S rRNA (adenine2030-N6)-methyltransferase